MSIPSTTAANACDVFLFLDDGAGALTEITGNANTANLSLNTEVGGYSVFGYRWEKKLACGSSGELTIDIVYDEDADSGYDIVRDWYFGGDYATARSLRIQVPDNAGEQFDFEVMLSSLELPLDRGEAGPIMVSVTLPIDGDIVHSTIGS